MLITYGDSIGSNIGDTHRILMKYADDAIGGIHLLPFFPSSGDCGFAPLTYREVDKALGDWNDIVALSEDYYLMTDYMINHIISAQSEYYKFINGNYI
jgi:sucrose phosphorylase